MNRPIVSVWLITYNHESYIAEAIEGVLMQVTDFPVELVIGEDYSSDRTRAIVQDYKNRYPDQITLFLAEYNMGMLPVLRPTYALCRGKYVAMLDGDDYWTDPLKLQKQVDQLEQNPTVRFSFHKVNILHSATGEFNESAEPSKSKQANGWTLEDFLCGNPVYTLSVLFRNDLGPLPDWYYSLPYPDLALFCLLLMHGGTAQYLPHNMGVYRMHRAGSFSGLTAQQRHQQSAQFFDLIRPHVPLEYQHIVNQALQHIRYELLILALKKFQLGSVANQIFLLGSYDTKKVTYRPKQWHHSLLFAGLHHTARTLYRVGMSIKAS
ncbi:glycosyltransferase family 2 protein [Hymenobacter sp. GOD-10R]|uniref:glycosyltransferase family 2 protein n=1 Tax=Hymenobacter sp. GOD-10R TaxID=3093922 RepID=UPI002D77D52B|nr:glycosyltransferase [Hymenobacter sp. GOD-10R]WRQ27358.1 glycosyltransferase [Hymenobacter sp. GOD-10R]